MTGGQPTLGDSSACWVSWLPAVSHHKKSFVRSVRRTWSVYDT